MSSDAKKFKVTFKGRTGLTYTEGQKSMKVDSELFVDPAGVTVYRDSIVRWNAPHDGTNLSEVDRNRIVENIKADLEVQGYKVDLA